MTTKNEVDGLICCDPARIQEVWPIVFDMIDSAYAAFDDPLPDGLKQMMIDGRQLLWLFVEGGRVRAVLTTALIQKRSGLVCQMVACGGARMDLWKRCHKQIEDYARAEGCYKVITKGRQGWARVLHGYRLTRISLEKLL